MTNYWNVYQTDLKSRLGKDYDENKAKQAWVQSKQYSNMNLDILQKSEDIYIDIAYSVRKEEQQNSKIKENKKRRKVE